MTAASGTFERLRNFILKRMQMQHVYQPVMLKELLSRGGSATVAEIASALLAKDQSQIEYYEQITKNMVGDVLTNRNGITRKIKEGNRVRGFDLPGFQELSREEVLQLIDLCQSEIDEFVSERGERIWSHRLKSSGYISGTVQFEVLKRAKFRCELCGTLDGDKALQVDHILPRNHGGLDDISNLQALCYSCNAMKRDRDDTDFRGIAESYEKRDANCLFCGLEEGRIIAQNALCYAILDAFPVTQSHTLIIPKRHVADFFDLYQPEINAVYQLLGVLQKKIKEDDRTVTGFNVGINSGETAGQTIFHCHIHLIPRRAGDVESPRGGVRGVIPGKQAY